MPSSRKRVLKIVLDANVWISALIWGGRPAEIIKAAEDARIKIFVSEEIVGEISQVLNYPKLKKVYQTAGLRHEELVEAMLRIVKFVEATERVAVIVEHPADDRCLECALAAGADYIISGDKHLLKIASYRKTRILSVSDFLEILKV